MKSKHTPGPWAFDDIGRQLVVLSRNQRLVCKLQKHHGEEPLTPVSQFRGSGEDVANARLIAAAPDMLRFLKEMQAVHVIKGTDEEYDEFEKELAALIAKAEGR